jgi:ubiquinone/menaquinone biosynthesis C-methylase UbiE
MHFFKTLKKLSTHIKICFILILVLLLINIRYPFTINNYAIEGYQNKSKKRINYYYNFTIYDNFYINIYDKLLYNSSKLNYETKELIKIVNINKDTKLLDIGCCTGHHCKIFKDNKAKVIGLDKSKAAIKQAKKNYPKCKFVLGNTLNMDLFDKESFNVLTCFYFTLYYIKNKEQFFKNCYYWLKPGGYLAIHLVNRDKFNPIIPAGDPLFIVSPQKYAKKRITTSLVSFRTFKYKSKFIPNKVNKDIVYFKETFKFKDGSFRINEHKLFMNDSKQIISLAQKYGFTTIAKIDLLLCNYDYQYVYILQK